MAINASKLVNYAAHSVSNVKIAQALGISESRVTQLLSDDRVKEAIEERKKSLAEENVTEAADLRAIGSKLINRMREIADDVDSMSEAVTAYAKIDALVDQKLGREDDSGSVRNILMQVPVFVQQNITHVITNDKNQVESIGERSMVPMSNDRVVKLIQEKKDEKAQGTILESFDPARVLSR